MHNHHRFSIWMTSGLWLGHSSTWRSGFGCMLRLLIGRKLNHHLIFSSLDDSYLTFLFVLIFFFFPPSRHKVQVLNRSTFLKMFSMSIVWRVRNIKQDFLWHSFNNSCFFLLPLFQRPDLWGVPLTAVLQLDPCRVIMDLWPLSCSSDWFFPCPWFRGNTLSWNVFSNFV